jgi:parallel beta-helix repeat protein
MTYTFKLSRRLAVSPYLGMFAILMLCAITTACSDNEPLDPDSRAPAHWDGAAQVEVHPHLVFAEINQRVQLGARLRIPDRELVAIPVEWSASGGSISADGLFSAKSTGTYKVVGRGRGGRKGDTTTVVVVDSTRDAVAVVLSPDTATLQSAEARQFSASAKLRDGSTVSVGIVWTADGGVVDAGGEYVAGHVPGHYHVVATNVTGTLADTAAVVVEATAPALVSLALTPVTTSLTAGGSQQFALAGHYSDGSTASMEAQYTASGGTITSAGLFTAGPLPGSYRVIATAAGGLADTSDVAVTALAKGPVIYPGSDIQAAVDANPPGTAFLLKAGVHRMQQVAPKDGDRFTGEVGTILNGSAILTDFAHEGSYWTVSGRTERGEIRLPDSCQPTAPGCVYPEQLFMNDAPLQHVTALSQVGPGKWYFDYDAHKVYMADDPRGNRVELSASPYAFYSKASIVTIEGLIVEKYASPTQLGAIGFTGPGNGWIVRGNEVRWNHGAGIRPGNGMQILSNNIHHQGQIGIAGSGSGVIMEGNELAYNNTAGFGSGRQGEAGGAKFTFTRGLVVRRNYSHNNHGPGLWTDLNNIDCLYDGNRVEDNDWSGIFHEVSYACVIRNNTVRRNGFHIPGQTTAVDGAGILVSSSRDTEIYGNVVEDNRTGIAGQETDRPTPLPPSGYGSHDLVNLWVHNNSVRQMDGGRAAGVVDLDPNADPYAQTANNRWANNTYTIGTATRWRWASNVDVSLSEWRRVGQDSGSTFQ